MGHIAAGVALFGIWHSLLCSRAAKRLARRCCGERAGRALYRLFFNLQSLVTMTTLVGFVMTRPHRIVYRMRGWARLPFWMAQGTALGIALWSVRELQVRRFAGLEGARDFKQGRAQVAEPEAQSPDGEDGSYERGPYRWSRHPVEWAPLLLLWLTPTLKTNWVAFNIVTSLYMVLGAWHEEKRLLDKGGAVYAAYQKRVKFFFGRSKD